MEKPLDRLLDAANTFENYIQAAEVLEACGMANSGMITAGELLAKLEVVAGAGFENSVDASKPRGAEGRAAE